MQTEEFVRLAKGTRCKIYPAIHARISMDGPNEHYRLMALANFRAAAHNYYSFGADGISPYNYHRGDKLPYRVGLRDIHGYPEG